MLYAGPAAAADEGQGHPDTALALMRRLIRHLEGLSAHPNGLVMEESDDSDCFVRERGYGWDCGVDGLAGPNEGDAARAGERGG